MVLAAGNYCGVGHFGAAGDAAGFGRDGDCAVRSLVAAGELAAAYFGDVLDVRWVAVAADALGGAQRADIRARGISGAALRAEFRRFHSARLHCVDANVDDAIWRRVLDDLEAGETADRRRVGAGCRVRFGHGTRARGGIAWAVQQRFRNDAAAGSRIRSARGGADGAESAAHLYFCAGGADCGDVVYAAHRIAALFGEAVAGGRALARESGGFWRHVWIWGFGFRVCGVGGGRLVAMPGAIGGDIFGFVCRDPDGGDDAAADGGAAVCD